MSQDTAVPKFRPGVKFRFDAVREAWMVLAPERLFMPDEIAVEVLKRIDGEKTSGQIIDDLAQAFAAPRQEIATDVHAMLGDLSDRGVLSL